MIFMKKHRIHYIFSGDVQEVGFRTTAYRTATQIGVTGWVRNLCDGTVEMEAQGFMPDLEELLSEIQSSMFISADNIESREIDVIDEQEFHIR